MRASRSRRLGGLRGARRRRPWFRPTTRQVLHSPGRRPSKHPFACWKYGRTRVAFARIPKRPQALPVACRDSHLDGLFDAVLEPGPDEADRFARRRYGVALEPEGERQVELIFSESVVPSIEAKAVVVMSDGEPSDSARRWVAVARWWYSAAGESAGPLEDDELRAMAGAGNCRRGHPSTGRTSACGGDSRTSRLHSAWPATPGAPTSYRRSVSPTVGADPFKRPPVGNDWPPPGSMGWSSVRCAGHWWWISTTWSSRSGRSPRGPRPGRSRCRSPAAALHAVRGQTVGKRCMGIEVVGRDASELLGLDRAFARSLVGRAHLARHHRPGAVHRRPTRPARPRRRRLGPEGPLTRRRLR